MSNDDISLQNLNDNSDDDDDDGEIEWKEPKDEKNKYTEEGKFKL